MDSVKSLVNKALKAHSESTTQASTCPQLQIPEESLQANLERNQSLTNLLLATGSPSPTDVHIEDNNIEIECSPDVEMKEMENKLTESKLKIN